MVNSPNVVIISRNAKKKNNFAHKKEVTPQQFLSQIFEEVFKKIFKKYLFGFFLFKYLKKYLFIGIMIGWVV
jgi:hypothetical protein